MYRRKSHGKSPFPSQALRISCEGGGAMLEFFKKLLGVDLKRFLYLLEKEISPELLGLEKVRARVFSTICARSYEHLMIFFKKRLLAGIFVCR